MSSLHVVSVVASPYGTGSSAAAVAAVRLGAEQAGATTAAVDLAVDADETVMAEIERAQAVIFGSPVYRASHSALLAGRLEKIGRGALDRGEAREPLAGKAAAIVMVGASAHHYLATEKLRGVLASFFAVQTLSPALYLTKDDFAEPKVLADAAAERARLTGTALVELATAVRDSTALRQLRPQI